VIEPRKASRRGREEIPQGGSEGNADGCQGPEGRRPAGARASSQDTTGVSARGLPPAGSLGNLGAPLVSWSDSRSGGSGDQRPGRRLGGATRPRAPEGDHERTATGQVWGRERQAQCPETGQGPSARSLVPTPVGNAGPQAPRAGRQRRAARGAGQTDGRCLAITNRHPTTPAPCGAGRPGSGPGVYTPGRPDRYRLSAGGLAPHEQVACGRKRWGHGAAGGRPP
jgi:hypothetical protein